MNRKRWSWRRVLIIIVDWRFLLALTALDHVAFLVVDNSFGLVPVVIESFKGMAREHTVDSPRTILSDIWFVMINRVPPALTVAIESVILNQVAIFTKDLCGAHP